MKLRAHLLLFGALFPFSLLVAGAVVSGLAFDRVLLLEHDRALLNQAALEAVSLFDRLGAPHLHLSESPLSSQVQEFAPRAALYDPSGRRLTRYPKHGEAPARLDPSTLSSDPVLRTIEGPGGTRERTLEVRVADPQGQPYGLWLATSLERHDREMASYWRISGLVMGVVGIVLLLGQAGYARRLARRVENLTFHMRRLRAGELEHAPPPDRARDEVGELREAIAETTRKLAAARQSQDRLVADAAHELRTPLAAMRAGIEVTLRRERTPAELREALEQTREEVERLGALADRLLDLAALRSSSLERAHLDLVPVLLDAVDRARALAEERGVLVELQAPARVELEFAPSFMRQALDNLLGNAIKFSPERGLVTVTVKAYGEGWEIAVSDEGPGVPERARKAIFQPFHRELRQVPGKGLGLAIVMDVVERHGGEVWVQDADPNRSPPGARFVLRFPA